MAFTERYVTSAAAGGGDGSIGSPWTLDESFDGVGASGGTAATAGDRVNVQSDGAYSIGATTQLNAGTAQSIVRWRGFNSSIGDLETQGRTNDQQALDITNFPDITLTGRLLPKVFTVFESLKFSGALNTFLIGGTGDPDDFTMIKVSLLNTLNNVSARAIRCDNVCSMINCDFECSGATHNQVCDFDNDILFKGCRIKSVANKCIGLNNGTIVNCVFIGGGSDVAIQTDQTSNISYFIGNTCYNIGTFLAIIDGNPLHSHILADNHVTDCAKYIDNLHITTNNVAVIEINNRTRDNTTPRTGIGDGVNINEITDTGDKDDDYTDTSTEDFTLISTAPGKAAGMIPFSDCGALQREEPAGGAGTDSILGGGNLEGGFS